MDCEEDRILRAVLIGMLRQTSGGSGGRGRESAAASRQLKASASPAEPS